MKNRRQCFHALSSGVSACARLAGAALAVLLASLFLAPGAQAGDLFALHAPYHPTDVIEDDTLLAGKWEVMGTVIEFEPLGQGVYGVRLEDEATVEVRLFRLGGRLFLDAELRAPREAVSAHLICRVGVTGGLALQCLDQAWAREHLADSVAETDGDEILNLSTDELREFLLRQGDNDDVFADFAVLERADAAEHLREAAEAGDVAAQEQLGLAHYDGEGAAADSELAFFWTARAAAQGSASAQNRLGEMYENGRGVERDYEQARVWYLKAAEQDYAPALFNLGRLYEEGLGVRESLGEAAAWYRQAAELDHAPALHRLGRMLAAGEGVELDHRAALAAFRRTVEVDPGFAEAWRSRAKLLLETWDAELADAKEAVRSAATAVSLTQRQKAEYLDTLAEAYHRAGDVKRAAATAQDALKVWSNPQRALRAQQLAFEADLPPAD
jgi:TPR repeat protein